VRKALRSRVRFLGADVVMIAGCWLAVLLLVGPGRHAPGAPVAASWFAGLALGLLVLRTLQDSWPRAPILKWLPDFWLVPVALVAHEMLGPLADAFSPSVRDAQLVRIEEWLFGGQVSVAVSSAVPGWLHDVLMVCYYGHFFWGVVLGAALYRQQRTGAFAEFLLGHSLFFLLSFAANTLVPVIGPRFFLPHAFPGPLTGPLLTPLLDSVLRMPTFARDCFPSGHTGTMLLVLFYAFRFSRRLFWIMLPPGLGLMVATLSGRFHYATDLVAALPLVVLVAVLARVLRRVESRVPDFTAERSAPVDAIVRR
jgi:hypothetical protein